MRTNVKCDAHGPQRNLSERSGTSAVERETGPTDSSVERAIGFPTHEITLRGHALRRIEAAMQRMELSFLMALPNNQRALVPDGQAVVTEIVMEAHSA